jgi:hypothetical protein
MISTKVLSLVRILLLVLLAAAANSLHASTLSKGDVLNGTVRLTWNCTGAYCPIEQSINGAQATTIKTVNLTGNLDVAVSQGNTYTFYLRTYTAGGTSPPVLTETDIVSVTPPPPEVLQISNISDKTILKNRSTGAISFTLTDTVISGVLSFQVTSSNPGVIPLSGIVLGGTGSARTVTVTPATDVLGSSTVRITASKGGKTTYDDFNVIVNPPPLDTTGPSNGELIVKWVCTGNIYCIVKLKNSNSGTWTSRTVTGTSGSESFAISPGLFNIALEHWSAGGTTGATLLRTDSLDKSIPNTAPYISNISDQSIYINNATNTITFSISDNETIPPNLQITTASSNQGLVPNNSTAIKIENGSSPNNRTVKITPAPNQGGTSTITLSVSDGQLTASDAIAVTVTPRPPITLTVPTSDIDGSFPVSWSAQQGTPFFLLELSSVGGRWFEIYRGSEYVYPAALNPGAYAFRVSACFNTSLCSVPKGSGVVNISGSQINTSRRVVFVHTDLLGSPAAETNEQGNENE